MAVVARAEIYLAASRAAPELVICR